jgi:hypothetical protein
MHIASATSADITPCLSLPRALRVGPIYSRIELWWPRGEIMKVGAAFKAALIFCLTLSINEFHCHVLRNIFDLASLRRKLLAKEAQGLAGTDSS